MNLSKVPLPQKHLSYAIKIHVPDHTRYKIAGLCYPYCTYIPRLFHKDCIVSAPLRFAYAYYTEEKKSGVDSDSICSFRVCELGSSPLTSDYKTKQAAHKIHKTNSARARPQQGRSKISCHFPLFLSPNGLRSNFYTKKKNIYISKHF